MMLNFSHQFMFVGLILSSHLLNLMRNFCHPNGFVYLINFFAHVDSAWVQSLAFRRCASWAGRPFFLKYSQWVKLCLWRSPSRCRNSKFDWRPVFELSWMFGVSAIYSVILVLPILVGAFWVEIFLYSPVYSLIGEIAQKRQPHVPWLCCPARERDSAMYLE